MGPSGARRRARGSRKAWQGGRQPLFAHSRPRALQAELAELAGVALGLMDDERAVAQIFGLVEVRGILFCQVSLQTTQCSKARGAKGEGRVLLPASDRAGMRGAVGELSAKPRCERRGSGQPRQRAGLDSVRLKHRGSGKPIRCAPPKPVPRWRWVERGGCRDGSGLGRSSQILRLSSLRIHKMRAGFAPPCGLAARRLQDARTH